MKGFVTVFVGVWLLLAAACAGVFALGYILYVMMNAWGFFGVAGFTITVIAAYVALLVGREPPAPPQEDKA